MPFKSKEVAEGLISKMNRRPSWRGPNGARALRNILTCAQDLKVDLFLVAANTVGRVGTKIDIDGKVFNIDDLSESAMLKVTSLQFSDQKITELKNLNALLQKAKLGYVESLKKEIISDKSGLLLNED